MCAGVRKGMRGCKCTQTQVRECVYVITGCLSTDVSAWIRFGEQMCCCGVG